MVSMLNLDQTTLANMTAALEYVYLKLPPEADRTVRRKIAVAITAAANEGKTSLVELQDAGLKVINETSPSKRSSLSRLFRWQRHQGAR